MSQRVKSKRQAALVELIQGEPLSSHEEILERLKERGFKTTQATISRDLSEIGVARVPGETGWRYQIPGRSSSEFGASLSAVWRSFVISTGCSGNLLVLHTPPGHAGVVAAALDRSRLRTVEGIIAGDDTIFVCCKEEYKPAHILDDIEELLS